MKNLESAKYRKFVDLLRRHGAGELVELPQVACVGDQSADKSSVLSALTGLVDFPSSAALCTRCPSQLVMTRADAVAATVYTSSTVSFYAVPMAFRRRLQKNKARLSR